MPAMFIYKFIEIRNKIMQRTAGAVTERYAAIHASCRLLINLIRCQWQIQFLEVQNPFLYRSVSDFLTFIFKKSFKFSHKILPL